MFNFTFLWKILAKLTHLLHNILSLFLQPIFLNRTLSYMKRRMSRSNKSRNGFKVDSLLEKITLKKSIEIQPNSLGGYMTLTFLGFYDKSLDDPRDYLVKVETLLLKICHKKRKESSSAIIEVSVSICHLLIFFFS